MAELFRHILGRMTLPTYVETCTNPRRCSPRETPSPRHRRSRRESRGLQLLHEKHDLPAAAGADLPIPVVVPAAVPNVQADRDARARATSATDIVLALNSVHSSSADTTPPSETPADAVASA